MYMTHEALIAAVDKAIEEITQKIELHAKGTVSDSDLLHSVTFIMEDCGYLMQMPDIEMSGLRTAIFCLIDLGETRFMERHIIKDIDSNT